MQYMILNYTRPEAYGGADEIAAADGDVWGAYTRALIDAGVMRGGNALHPSASAVTLRVRDGARDVQDGPFADSREHLGGYYVIEVPDLDTALLWAARNPAASDGAVEVRQVVEF